jgi:hypothetical protein
MIKLQKIPYRFLKMAVDGQSYLNLIYLLAAFPLGLIYFVFLVTGLSLGISLSIIWVGIPLLAGVVAGWWVLARFERLMAVHWLKADIPAIPSINPQIHSEGDFWGKIKIHLTNPVTWKSPVYLFFKFPLGLATFTILVTLVSLTLATLTLPLTYETFDVQIGGFFSPGSLGWQVDNPGEAFLGTLIGLLLWPLTMLISNGLAWVHAKFARLMLSVNPIG